MPNLPVLAHHLILSSYGFWLPNDPRGSGSGVLREKKFADLGPIHLGRKLLQPTRAELRTFYALAFPKLDHAPVWFSASMRELIGAEFARVVARRRYTVWGCSIGSNHVHLCIRRHRDTYQTMFENLAGQSRVAFADAGLIDAVHPLWAQRPYSVFCHSPSDIRRVISYIQENPSKEGLANQAWGFVVPYAGWPGPVRVRTDA